VSGRDPRREPPAGFHRRGRAVQAEVKARIEEGRPGGETRRHASSSKNHVKGEVVRKCTNREQSTGLLGKSIYLRGKLNLTGGEEARWSKEPTQKAVRGALRGGRVRS